MQAAFAQAGRAPLDALDLHAIERPAESPKRTGITDAPVDTPFNAVPNMARPA